MAVNTIDKLQFFSFITVNCKDSALSRQRALKFFIKQLFQATLSHISQPYTKWVKSNSILNAPLTFRLYRDQVLT